MVPAPIPSSSPPESGEGAWSWVPQPGLARRRPWGVRLATHRTGFHGHASHGTVFCFMVYSGYGTSTFAAYAERIRTLPLHCTLCPGMLEGAIAWPHMVAPGHSHNRLHTACRARSPHPAGWSSAGGGDLAGWPLAKAPYRRLSNDTHNMYLKGIAMGRLSRPQALGPDRTAKCSNPRLLCTCCSILVLCLTSKGSNSRVKRGLTEILVLGR